MLPQRVFLFFQIGCIFRKNQRLVLCKIDEEKVAVETRLDRSCDPDDPVDIMLRVIAVDPIGQVKTTVCTQCKQIVCRNDLGLSGLCQHEQLRQYRHCLEIDRERPEDLMTMGQVRLDPSGIIQVSYIVIFLAMLPTMFEKRA